MFNELKLYCKSEGLSEYLRSEARIVSPSKASETTRVKRDPDRNKRNLDLYRIRIDR